MAKREDNSHWITSRRWFHGVAHGAGGQAMASRRLTTSSAEERALHHTQAGTRRPWGTTRRESWPRWTMLSISASSPNRLWRAQDSHPFWKSGWLTTRGWTGRGWPDSIRCVAGFARVCLKQFQRSNADRSGAGAGRGARQAEDGSDQDKINWSNLATSSEAAARSSR
jgi:hypothetical protein